MTIILKEERIYNSQTSTQEVCVSPNKTKLLATFPSIPNKHMYYHYYKKKVSSTRNPSH